MRMLKILINKTLCDYSQQIKINNNLINLQFMKLKNFNRLLFFAFLLLFVTQSCVKEGPMGTAGTNGTNGTNGVAGTVTCLACHGTLLIDSIQGEFYASEHYKGAVAVTTEGGNPSCARCHSSQGFIEFMTLGAVIDSITKPAAWDCTTCHGLHTTFTYTDIALRTSTPPVPFVTANGTMDLIGNSNLCATCHQTRTAEPNVVTPGAATVTLSSHFGPHHGPQSDVVYGKGFAQIAGTVAYPAAGSSTHLQKASCVGCHMAQFANMQGGHSLVPSLNACNNCHNATDTNYDHNGVQTEIKGDLATLQGLLVAKGLLIYTSSTNTYAIASGKFPMVQAQALFNYEGLTDDKSNGVHNPAYIRALLENSIQALQ